MNHQKTILHDDDSQLTRLVSPPCYPPQLIASPKFIDSVSVKETFRSCS